MNLVINEIVHLPIRSDLSLASFEAALDMVGASYYVLGGARQLQIDVIECITKKWPVGFVLIPTQMLSDEYNWCLTGRSKNNPSHTVAVIGWWKELT